MKCKFHLKGKTYDWKYDGWCAQSGITQLFTYIFNSSGFGAPRRRAPTARLSQWESCKPIFVRGLPAADADYAAPLNPALFIIAPG